MAKKREKKKVPEPAPELIGPPPHPATVWLHRYRFVFLALVFTVVVSSDQVTKLWLRGELARPLPPVMSERGVEITNYRPVKQIRLIDGIFHLRYVENPSSAFSLTLFIPERYRVPLLIGINYLAMAMLMVWIFKLKHPDVVLLLGLSLVMGGAAGNLIDRPVHGYVIDFIDWRLTRFVPDLPPWPIFNIADSGIVCGAACIIFRSLLPYERRFKRQSADDEAKAGAEKK